MSILGRTKLTFYRLYFRLTTPAGKRWVLKNGLESHYKAGYICGSLAGIYDDPPPQKERTPEAAKAFYLGFEQGQLDMIARAW